MIKISDLEEKVGVKAQTIAIYLDRQEFSHIHKYRGYVDYISPKDLNRLQVIAASRRKTNGTNN